jgi:hypothetical protein
MRLPETGDGEHEPHIKRSRTECFTTPKGRAYLKMLREAGLLVEPHELAARLALRERAAAGGPDPTRLRAALGRLLGRTDPEPSVGGTSALRTEPWQGYTVEGYLLPAERGGPEGPALGLPAWLISKPDVQGARPAVLGVCQSGKAGFLAGRLGQCRRLLDAGVVVALIDVRGAGETSPGPSRLPEGESATISVLLNHQNDSLVARRVKDVRTGLAWLAADRRIDAGRIALWGEGFSEPNGRAGRPLRFAETGFRQAGPVPMQLVETTGPWVVMLAALYPVAPGTETRVRAVLARGGVYSFESVLGERHYYLPVDAVLPGLLRKADVADVARCLAADGVKLLAEDLRDGQNRAVDVRLLVGSWGAAGGGYREHVTGVALAELIDALGE